MARKQPPVLAAAQIHLVAGPGIDTTVEETRSGMREKMFRKRPALTDLLHRPGLIERVRVDENCVEAAETMQHNLPLVLRASGVPEENAQRVINTKIAQCSCHFFFRDLKLTGSGRTGDSRYTAPYRFRADKPDPP